MPETQHGQQQITSTPAPRVHITPADEGAVIEPAADSADPNFFRAQLLAAFGTTELSVAEALLKQVLCIVQAGFGTALDASTANLVLALMHRIAPKDELEAMLACQMIVAHVSAMDANRRALHAEQTPGGRQAYLSLARKLMTLFAAQMDALNRHRGKATIQRVIVERVIVGPAGQAVVESLKTERRGDGR
jgi:hypothetical protein